MALVIILLCSGLPMSALGSEAEEDSGMQNRCNTEDVDSETAE
jgi:hypothetical protein